MRYDVELIVSAGGTSFVNSGPYTTAFNPTGGTVANIADIGNPPANLITIGTIITGPNGGLVTTSTVVAFDPNTGDITFDAFLDYSNISPTPVSQDIYIDTFVDTLISSSLELYENEVISQNWRFSDLQTFAALGSFSRQFRVPATKRNLMALGYLPDVNFKAETDYFQTKLTAELRVQTLPIAIGYIRVMRVITQAEKLADFELTFYAESPDLFNKIAGKKLKDIAALNDLNAPLDYNEVINATGYPYLYSLTDYGQKWDQSGAQNARSIYATSIGTAPRAGDLTPSLNWQWIFSKILEEAGFTYTAVDLDNVLNQYYAPWINSKQLVYTQNVQSFIFRFYNATPLAMNTTQQALASVTENFDNGSTVSSGVFTAPITGLYTFRYWYTFNSPNSMSGLFTVYYNNITTGAVVAMNSSAVFSGDNNFDSANGAPYFFLAAGDQFQLLYQAPAATITLKAGTAYNTGTGVELIDANFMDGLTLNWSANAPDMTQSDFMRDVLNMHCCVIVPDRGTPNAVIIQNISDYVGTGSDRDWSSKLDISKDITLSNTSDFQNKQLKFTYSEGEDVASKIYSGLNRIYGDYKIDNYTVSVNDVPNDFASDSEQQIQLITQSTPSNYIKGTSIVIPKFIDENGDFVSPKMRCLFHAGDYEMSLYDFATFTADTSFVVPVLNHYELIVPLFSSRDLNWAPEVPLYTIGAIPYKTLFNEYWRDYLNQLYSPQARIMEAYFALDLGDILSFKFSDRIWVKDAWWRILDINDYKVGSSDVTQVRLLKIIDAVPEAQAEPDDIADNGVVSFIDGNGDPVGATQETCERFGYFWDPVTSTCYGFTTTPQIPPAPVDERIGSSSNEISNSINSIVMTERLNNDASNTYTIAVGSDIKMDAGNTSSIAVGEKLIMEGTGGVSMFGRNVYSKVSGQHLGGGYLNNIPATSPEGYAQSGVVMYQSKQAFAAAGQYFLFINGVNGEHLDLPDDTCWSCILNYTIQDDNFTGNYETGQLSFALIKSGGVAAVSAITPLNVIGGIGAYIFGIAVNVAVPNLHRLYYTVGGAPFPDTFHVTASLIYTQSKIS